jgi:hypothetical protein
MRGGRDSASIVRVVKTLVRSSILDLVILYWYSFYIMVFHPVVLGG